MRYGGASMPTRLPQARSLKTLRALLAAVAEGMADAKSIGVRLGAGENHPGRHAQYYQEAAVVLHLLEPRRWSLTARGRALLATEPGSADERELLRNAIRSAKELGPIAASVVQSSDPDHAALEAWARVHAPQYKESTLPRRVRDTLSWRKWLRSADTPAAPQPGRDMRHRKGPARPSFADLDLSWPDPRRLPYNWPAAQRSVGAIVEPDLLTSDDVLVVTGFGSLRRLCAFISQIAASERPHKVRVVFGAEPFEGRDTRHEYPLPTLDAEMTAYWLREGISILHAGEVHATITALISDRLQTRISAARERLHAKMYVSSAGVTVGSSNFTEPGMSGQLEANVRLTTALTSAEAVEEARGLAENYWRMGTPYNDQLRVLLEQLLKPVTWEQALARACAELLEGEWARDFLKDELGLLQSLWPSQLQGIGQALYVLMNVGSVLYADAAGSGKTRTAAWLLRALRHALITTGRAISDPVLISPPAVREAWADELAAAGVVVEAFSHGSLSNVRTQSRGRTITTIETSRVMALDEAHNFINRSLRTRAVHSNLADHVLLFTATPINKAASDLLRIVDLLGADNLDDETLEILSASRNRSRQLSEHQLELLRRAVSSFTVRRTKAMFNALIDLQPTKYLNVLGQPCRYPVHDPQYYTLKETRADRAIARQINALCGNLRGIVWLNAMRLPPRGNAHRANLDKYVRTRLRNAAALARYYVRSTLRSSRAALWEHLYGTERACEEYGVKHLEKQTSGNMAQEVREMLNATVVPVDSELPLPPWLATQAGFRGACERELATYNEIARLVSKLSSQREEKKAEHLLSLCRKHEMIVAFDAKPITLKIIQDMLRQKAPAKLRVLLATGTSQAEQRKVQRAFRVDAADAGQCIALCSNAMSEGVNLQKASVVVNLDMPSVVRVAEQRVGRVERMDSPHSEVQSWWPKDGKEFALTSDDLLGARLALVREWLGGNLDLPADATEVPDPIIPQDMVRELKRQEETQVKHLDDAFAEVRAFVEGERALVSKYAYEELRKTKAKVVAAVATVRSELEWGFFAVRGSRRSAPRWFFVGGGGERAQSVLNDVASSLRAALTTAQDVPLDDAAVEVMKRLVGRLEDGGDLLLPRRKQRALVEMKRVLEHYSRHPANRDGMAQEVIEELLARVDDKAVDRDELADAWIACIRPRWRAHLQGTKGRPLGEFLRLAALTEGLIAEPLADQALEQLRRKVFRAVPIDEQIVAAIIGVPG
jgi:hypothetical protein